MQAQTRNVLAAAVAGVILGAFATAVLLSNNARRAREPRVERSFPGVNPDDIVAVLDTDRVAVPHPSSPAAPAADRPAGAPAAVDPEVPRLSAAPREAIDDLRSRRLTMPVRGVDRSKLVQSFHDPRGGTRMHEAIDILAPRHTPVFAVEDGRIARLFVSKAGGITIYQFDPSDRYVYYYAHLERYAEGLKESAAIKRGQHIGYVGTSGNAPPNTPHLHFAIFEMTAKRRWWEGVPIDPFLVLR